MIFLDFIGEAFFWKSRNLWIRGTEKGTFQGIDFDAIVRRRNIGSSCRDQWEGWGQEILLEKLDPGAERKNREEKEGNHDQDVFISSFQNVVSNNPL